MYDVSYLCERFGLTTKQVRDRLTVLSPAMTEHLLQGKHGAKVLTDGGLAIFDRLLQLERGGLSVTAAVERINNERLEALKPAPSTSVSESLPNGESRVIDLLARQVDDLRAERDRLLTLLETKEEQMLALMPGPQERANGERRLTRFQALRFVLLGR